MDSEVLWRFISINSGENLDHFKGLSTSNNKINKMCKSRTMLSTYIDNTNFVKMLMEFKAI